MAGRRVWVSTATEVGDIQDGGGWVGVGWGGGWTVAAPQSLTRGEQGSRPQIGHTYDRADTEVVLGPFLAVCI